MKFILKKSIKVDGIELKAGSECWLRGIQFGGKDGEVCICDVGEHRLVPIDKSNLTSTKPEIKP